ncbi:hypothetical protein LMF89_17935 [Pelosinus sp. Bkl1]|uniref:Uncharacterized protein n=1 Tax=Pelosinus baikalensis TaxID=2892015 RepID=A0ABS8HVM0_9FIRM|nr:hypothetical protein [Pelosinus baikalensis]
MRILQQETIAGEIYYNQGFSDAIKFIMQSLVCSVASPRNQLQQLDTRKKVEVTLASLYLCSFLLKRSHDKSLKTIV